MPSIPIIKFILQNQDLPYHHPSPAPPTHTQQTPHQQLSVNPFIATILFTHIHIFLITTTNLVNAMPPCPHCGQNYSRLLTHLSLGCHVLTHTQSGKKKKRSSNFHNATKSNKKTIRQYNSTAQIESTLASDTHCAPKSITSQQLFSKPSGRNLATQARISQQKSNNCPEDNLFSTSDDNNIFTDDICPDANLKSTSSNKSTPTDVEKNDLEFMDQFVRHIDDEARDPFHPDDCEEDDIQFIQSTYKSVGKLPDHILAQIDLLRMLNRSGCSLAMYDKILNWVLHYSKKYVHGNIWTECRFDSRKKFLRRISKTFGTEGHYPIHKVTKFDYDGRQASIPTYSFATEVLSLLHDPSIMDKDNIIPGYDIFSGLVNGSQYWDPSSLKDHNTQPVPIDPNRKIGDITSGYLFQQSVQRFCTRSHHMPIPLIFFYDKANLDRKGGLAVAPVIFTIGFFKVSKRRKSNFWRMLGYVPNLEIGLGRSDCKDANIKQQEHHQVLSLLFSDLRSICNKGGIKTVIQNRKVILNFFIQFIIGDTAGHNDLCLQFQTNAEQPCRTCHCPQTSLSIFDSSQCIPKTYRDIINTHGNKELLRKLSLRYRVVNSLYTLPLSNRSRGIFGCTPWESLHVFDQGLFGYIMESFHDIFGEKSAGKTDKERFNNFFRVISYYMARQSERDFPRRSTRFSWIEGTRITATERLGNLVVLLISFYVRDVKLFVSGVFDKYRSRSTNSTHQPTVK